MNEVIGARGGSNDRRRYFIRKSKFKRIKRHYLQQKRKKLIELEKKVKKQQVLTFIKAMSLVIPLGAIDILLKNVSKKDETRSIFIHNINHLEKNFNKEKKENKQNKNINHIIMIPNVKDKIDNKKEYDNKYVKNKKKEEKTNKKSDIPKKDEKLADKKNIKKTKNHNAVSKIRDKKIISYYEDKFKQQRTELKKIIYEYDKLKTKNIEMHDVEELEKMRDSLNLLIERLEDLEKTTYSGDVPDKYFYNFIDDYIKKFKNKDGIEMVKDSDLFILISSELSKVEQILEEKQESISSIYDNLEIGDDSNLNSNNDMKEYFVFEKFNKDLYKFQDKQVKIVGYIENNMPDIEEIDRKIKIKMGLMNLECSLLFAFVLTAGMKRPSVRTAKAMAVSTLVGIYFMNQIMKDKYNKDNLKQKQLKKEEYEKEIEDSISSIDDTMALIYKTTGELDKLINSIKEEYSDYTDSNIYTELLENLFTIKNELLEKEYELMKLKQKENKMMDQHFKKYEKTKNKVD